MQNYSSVKSDIGNKLLCGSIAGIIGTTLIFPLDIVKTRLQSQLTTQHATHMNGHNGWMTFKNIVKTQGFKGLYSGLIPNLIGVTPEKAIKLAVNDLMRLHLSKSSKMYPNGFKSDQLPLHLGMLAGLTAGTTQVVATNPMEIVKIHLQMEGASSTHTQGTISTKSQLQRALHVVNSLGLKGLYKGTSATLARDVPFSIIFFPASVYFKQNLFRTTNNSFSLISTLTSGCVAGIIAAILVTPMDVVKTRLQFQLESTKLSHTSMSMVYKDIYKTYGIKGFFKGAFQRALTIAPLFGTATFVYEFQQQFWKQQ